MVVGVGCKEQLVALMLWMLVNSMLVAPVCLMRCNPTLLLQSGGDALVLCAGGQKKAGHTPTQRGICTC